MKNIKPLLFLILISLTSYSYAGIWSGKITKLEVVVNGIYYVTLDGNYRSKPACNTLASMAFHVRNAGGKALLATLMMAKASDDTVSIRGYGSCALQPNVETLLRASVL